MAASFLPYVAAVALVLLVDDNPGAFDTLRRSLAERNVELLHAGEIEEAEALLAHRRFDALLVDVDGLGPAGALGLGILGFVRMRSPWTRVVLLAREAPSELVAEARAQGAEDLWAKPQRREDLVQAVLALVSQA